MSALLEYQVMDLLDEYGIAHPDYALAKSESEAVDAIGKLSLPLVMKIVSPDVLHKSDVGGVLLGLKNEKDVKDGYDRIIKNVSLHKPEADLHGVILYPMAPEGLEVIVGVTQDVTFGPVIMFGLGGIFVELLRDVTFRAIPITMRDARQMINGIKNSVLLEGWRGSKPIDKEKLADVLYRVSNLVSEHDEISELDLNPVRITEEGLFALDARIILKE
jgi:acyl-CoA synthetase (NDP forming)